MNAFSHRPEPDRPAREPINVVARPIEPPPPPGFSVSDIAYLFFRHKWKILGIFCLGLAGAVGFYFLRPPPYQSEAKILIRYILEAKTAAPTPGGAADSQLKSPDSRGENIINSEIEILTSFDLAAQVADLVGPEKILARLGGGTNRLAAAGAIRGRLRVDVPRRSNIILIQFRHPDPTVVQPVLSSLVDTYLKRHVEIHQGVGVMDDFFSRQADQLRSKLSKTDDELKKLKTDSQILSLEENKRAFISQKERIEEELFAATADLAAQRASLETFEKLHSGKPVAGAASTTNLPPDVTERYRLAWAEVELLRHKQTDLQQRFTDEHPQVKRGQLELSLAEARRAQLEKDYPALITQGAPSAPAPVRPTETDPTEVMLKISALQARIKELTNQLEVIRVRAGSIIENEPLITGLQRQKEVEEANLRYYSTSLEQARVDESLGAGKITNISIVQQPSPPARDTKDLLKPIGALLAFGLLGGFVLAFLIERFLDQSLRRVSDIERLVRVPVFVTVPDLARLNGHTTAHLLPAGSPPSSGSDPSSDLRPPSSVVSSPSSTPTEPAPWDAHHKLRAYYEGLRDRLITHFEVRNLTHKPKLVAVTSCHHGAGVTTMAAGLAATLSETGDGNVLLVDMNLDQGAAHPFYQGKPGVALSDALETATRDSAQVQENLYLVTAYETKNEKLPRVLPKRFAHLVPRMKASDYDYIIFDMPPITQTSVTPRLSGFMDMVLVVVESGTTGQEKVKRANALLSESRANVAMVLNKHRAYIPARLNQEL